MKLKRGIERLFFASAVLAANLSICSLLTGQDRLLVRLAALPSWAVADLLESKSDEVEALLAVGVKDVGCTEAAGWLALIEYVGVSEATGVELVIPLMH